MMSGLEIAGLALSAAAAGAINAVAGGGTLITFPTLLFFGTPPVVANATSTLALVIGTAGSVFGYRRHIAAVRVWLWSFLPVSLIGGLIGAVLLTHTSNKTFAKLVPFLILFATVLFVSQGIFRQFAKRHNSPAPSEKEAAFRGALLFQFLVAIYGGFFGAGIGILMLASLGFIGLSDIHEMNTVKTVLGSVINVIAALWFIYAGLIHWPKAAVMTAGALAGYYFGSHYSQRIPQKSVRQIITAVGLIISAATFYKEFIR